eukprot:TRINITY_DN6964_c0_g3_i1.p3 TRINITY_DN6964_c0_g3~~TRINITY_DN6964_c0_g3_i1.p3  ORF type:complete len:109 (+),score=7.49 TRINITY_DN6964_c0_g3_i1:776-1102(+)
MLCIQVMILYLNLCGISESTPKKYWQSVIGMSPSKYGFDHIWSRDSFLAKVDKPTLKKCSELIEKENLHENQAYMAEISRPILDLYLYSHNIIEYCYRRKTVFKVKNV